MNLISEVGSSIDISAIIEVSLPTSATNDSGAGFGCLQRHVLKPFWGALLTDGSAANEEAGRQGNDRGDQRTERPPLESIHSGARKDRPNPPGSESRRTNWGQTRMLRSKPAAIVATIVAAGFAWSALNPGPLPGDVAFTRNVQRLLGNEPAWAGWITDAAKFPYAWATLAVAGAVALFLRGWHGAAAAGAAFAVSHGIDKLLRLVVHVPRPSPELVAVASPATSSGLPSTFGLVFGALIGLTLIAAIGQRRSGATVIAVFSAALLVAGFLARVALGGHWPSQMLLSLLLGGLAGAAVLGLAARLSGKKPERV